MKRALMLALAAMLLLAATPVRVPQAEIDAENARWTALGVKLPASGIVKPEPYAAPYDVHSFIVPSSWYDRYYTELKSGHMSVQASAVREDLATLHFVMQKTYAGYVSAQERYKWNWTAWFKQWDAALARMGNAKVPLKEAFAPWASLQNVQLDNHSGVANFDAFNSGSQSAQLAGRPAAPCTSLTTARATYHLNAADKGQQPHAVQEWNGQSFAPAWYMSFPQRDGVAKSVSCGRPIALHALSSVSVPQVASYETLAAGIAYVRMPTFTDANDDAIRAALTKAGGLGKERVVIFDLRGNDGGNAPVDVISNWFAQSAVDQASQFAQTGTQSCFRNALFFGLQQQLALKLKPPVSAGMSRFLQNIVDLVGQPTSCDIIPQVVRATSQLQDHHFARQFDAQGQTRAIALVDSGCGSDCEYMTAILAGLPGTVIAGTSTYGVMGFSQPGYFVLPHSGVAFRLALSRTDAYGDNRSVDGYGVSVDVLLPTAQSQSKEALLALAKSLI